MYEAVVKKVSNAYYKFIVYRRRYFLKYAFWQHFRTVTRHRHMVMVHCFKAGIPLQGLLHDISKYSPGEFFVSAKFYQGNRSPNEKEREEKGYSTAWIHHKGRNKHHFEYWTDYSPVEKGLAGVEMPVRYVAEMFCDRVAASKTYRGAAYKQSDPETYFLGAKTPRLINPRTQALLGFLVKMLANEGEKTTFAYLRKLVRSGSYPPFLQEDKALSKK